MIFKYGVHTLAIYQNINHFGGGGGGVTPLSHLPKGTYEIIITPREIFTTADSNGQNLV